MFCPTKRASRKLRPTDISVANEYFFFQHCWKAGGGGVWGERKNFGRTIFNKLTEICTVFQYHFRKFIKIFPTIITFQNIMLHFLMNYIFLPNERVVKIAKIPRQNCNITTWGCGLSPPPPNAHTHIHTHYTHTQELRPWFHCLVVSIL